MAIGLVAAQTSTANPAAPAELGVFLGCGPPGGPGTIEQISAEGKRCGKITLFGPPSGLVHRGDCLVAAVPSVNVPPAATVTFPVTMVNELVATVLNCKVPLTVVVLVRLVKML